jgi:predicted peptidase
MRSWFPALFALSLVLAPAGAFAQDPAPGQQQGQSFSKQVTKTLAARYLLYLPKDYGKDPAARWPLILFLHGAGESGDNLEIVKKHGPPKLAAGGKEFPFIIVSPQAPSSREGWNVEVLTALLDEVMRQYAVDPDRVYLTGLSMGGFGTWNLAAAVPERFAAIAPICGGGQRRMARRLRTLPTWVFHGAKDPTVPLQESQEMVDALKAAGGDVKFTIYPDAGHDSWTVTYDNPELYSWFLQHKRGGATQ